MIHTKKDNIWQTDIVYVLSVSPNYFAISLVKTSLYYSHFASLQKLSFCYIKTPHLLHFQRLKHKYTSAHYTAQICSHTSVTSCYLNNCVRIKED